MPNNKGLFANLGSDLPSGLVVFLVALPLCLGIALSSGAPLFSGIIAGVVGGIVIGSLSGSHTSVSGPAAGLTVIVLNAISDLGTYDVFLTAVFIAGIMQIGLGIAKAGIIGYYFPTSVIKGMLAGIGIILIIKQIPYAFGVNENANLLEYTPFVNDLDAVLSLRLMLNAFDLGSVIVAVVSLAILILWEKPFIQKNKFSKVIPGALLAVMLSIGLNKFFKFFIPNLYIDMEDKVSLPSINGFGEFVDQLIFFNPSGFLNPDVWIVAITIAVIASLETLLSLEAADKIDPYKRVSPPNKELLAQGVGNMINGLVGGMPVTAVIVRSSANVSSGGKSKLSAIFHGVLLLGSVLLIPNLLNLIPLASLAAILLLVGYKLAKVSLFRTMYRLGWDQFLPFAATIFGIIVFDLLKGIGLGMVIGVIFILLRNYKNSYFYKDTKSADSNVSHIILSEEVSFLNKGALISALNRIPTNSKVIIDGSKSVIIDYDVLEVIENFKTNAKERDIEVETINIKGVKTASAH